MTRFDEDQIVWKCSSRPAFIGKLSRVKRVGTVDTDLSGEAKTGKLGGLGSRKRGGYRASELRKGLGGEGAKEVGGLGARKLGN